jgi:hypothetical protein
MATKEKGRWQAARVSAVTPDHSSKRRAYSLRSAINANCRNCIYDPLSLGGTWREQVAECSVISCALWTVRPAPSSGPYADPPRDPATVTREWRRRPLGWANSGHPTGENPE